MKYLIAAVVALSASTAFAGGTSEPIIEPEVIVDNATNDDMTGLYVAAGLFTLIVIAAASSDSGSH